MADIVSLSSEHSFHYQISVQNKTFYFQTLNVTITTCYFDAYKYINLMVAFYNRDDTGNMKHMKISSKQKFLFYHTELQ